VWPGNSIVSSFSRSKWFLSLLLTACLMGQASPTSDDVSPEIETHFAAAQRAQANQDYAAAENEYRAVLKVAPEFAEVHMNLGLVYQLQSRVPEAMKEFRIALKLKPTLAGANFFVGVGYCKEGQGAAAIPYLKAAVAEQSSQADLWSWLATAQDMAGQWQAEIDTLHRALQLHPRNVDLLYLLGQAYERLGKGQVAVLKKSVPDSVRAEQLVAESYASGNEWPSAVIHFENALAKAPNFPGLHVELGEAFLHAGKLKQARAEFERELEVDPASLHAIVRLGEAKLLQGETNDALQEWAQALAIDQQQTERIVGMREAGFGDAALERLPDSMRPQLDLIAEQLRNEHSPTAQFALSFIGLQENEPAAPTLQANVRNAEQSSCSTAAVISLLKEERFSPLNDCVSQALTARFPPDLRIRVASALVAVGAYESSLQLLDSLPLSQKRSPEASYWRIRCYEKLATAAYLQLYQADPNSYRVHQLLGDLAVTRDEDGKAIEEYRAAVARGPNASNLHYSLGHILWKDLNVPDARTELEAELKINPRHAGALQDLGCTFLLEHQPEKALPYLESSLEIDSSNPDIHRDLGTAYTELKEYAKAEAEYKLALASDRDGSVHYKLARVYQALGQKENAHREFAIYSSMNRETHEKLVERGQRLAEIGRLAQ